MNIQAYDPLTEATNLTELMLQMRNLAKPETALAALPADTTFAIIAALLERDVTDTFWTTTVSAGNAIGSVRIGGGADDGYQGRFHGYLAVAGNKFRVYKDGQLYIEEPMSNISVYFHQAEYVIQTTTKKFKVTNTLPITQTNGRFESKASGINGGLNPLFDIFIANGASVKRAGGVMYTIYPLVVLAFVAGIIALIFLKK